VALRRSSPRGYATSGGPAVAERGGRGCARDNPPVPRRRRPPPGRGTPAAAARVAQEPLFGSPFLAPFAAPQAHAAPQHAGVATFSFGSAGFPLAPLLPWAPWEPW